MILYEKGGKAFQWQKYDYQNQFHLSQINCLEQVCAGTLIRVHKDSAKIEIKQELKRFEDRFYEFKAVMFKGLPIFVDSFIPYRIPGIANRFLLCIKPEATLLNRKVLPQYFIFLDSDAGMASELHLEGKRVFSHVFFYNETNFIGQISISPTIQEIADYKIEAPSETEMIRFASPDRLPRGASFKQPISEKEKSVSFSLSGLKTELMKAKA